ncbi:hypothetical protein Patl1_01838 [Pistacia atlantica]|uniref:Uncharacterized protein n=1 Tax=Pistacia atlantica TaxID=434234 RepID=A0ACC1C622_9ROSI|nr:hypothetical protein Patl1_01838 [Pistacia atlantica]
MEVSNQENGGLISVKSLEPIFIQPEKKPYNGTHLLSNLDRAVVAMMKTIYIYNLDGKTSSEAACDVIKQALSKVLVYYYPLAGRLKSNSDGKLFVECIDTEGVPFVEAIANFSIVELGDITVPDTPKFEKFIYEVPGVENILEMPLMTVQVTRFKCGGFALGLTMNHCVADGKAGMEFVNSWAEIARGVPLTTPPVLDNSMFMSGKRSPLDKSPTEKFNIVDISDVSNLESQYQKENTVYKSFSFDQNKLAELKKKAMEEDEGLKYCSSFTVLAALVWRARNQTLKMEPHQKSRLLFTVDIRSKLNTPLPKGFFGNGIVTSECTCTASELSENPFSFAVKMVQNAIKKVNEDYVQSYNDFFENISITIPPPSLTGTLVITSWTRIAFNSADFGWGEASQFGSVEIPKEVCLFSPAGIKETEGVMLILGLPVSAMNTFQELMNKV